MNSGRIDHIQNISELSAELHLPAPARPWNHMASKNRFEFSTAFQLGAALKNTVGRWPSIGIRVPVSTSTISRILTCKHHSTQVQLVQLVQLGSFRFAAQSLAVGAPPAYCAYPAMPICDVPMAVGIPCIAHHRWEGRVPAQTLALHAMPI